MRHLLHKAAVALAAYGPWGVFILAAADSVGVPLPEAVDLVVIGTAAHHVHEPGRAYGVALLAAAGSLIGNLVLFRAARHGRRLFAWRNKDSGSCTTFERWFSRYGLLTVFVSATTPVVPLPLKVFVITAGALRARFWRFFAVILAARSVRYLGLAWLGLQLGQDAMGFLRRYGPTLAGAALLLVLMVVLLRRCAFARDTSWNGRQATETLESEDVEREAA